MQIGEDLYAALRRLAQERGGTPEDILAQILIVPTPSPEAAESLATFVIGSEFGGKTTDDEKYLALLGWIAERHLPEFGEFICSQCSGNRYLSMSREEILETCRNHQARQIDGTQFWAIMNIDLATKRRFLARMLDYIGYRDTVIELACSAFGGPMPARRRRLAAVMA